MSIIFEQEVEYSLDFNAEELIHQVVDAALDYMNCPYEANVNVLFTDNAGIHEMNREFRNIDRETDVLSFPMIDYETPADFSRLEEDPDSYFDPESGELLFGDIVISLEKAEAQSKEYGHSMKREVAFLIAHSMLHLGGYDHMEDEERLEMERMQEEILQKLGITRDSN